MTKSSNSAGCNKRNISATLCLLRPVAERQATHECNERRRIAAHPGEGSEVFNGGAVGLRISYRRPKQL